VSPGQTAKTLNSQGVEFDSWSGWSTNTSAGRARADALERAGLPHRGPPPLGDFAETFRDVASAARLRKSSTRAPHPAACPRHLLPLGEVMWQLALLAASCRSTAPAPDVR
jgi:hypothetical protein